MKCLQCGEETSNPKFCSRSCSASYNNIGVRRHGTTKYCKFCNRVLNKNQVYCNSICFANQKRYEYIHKWKLGLVNGTICNDKKVSGHIRSYLFDKYNNRCQLCGWNKIHKITNRVPLEVHHIDGNYKNNKPNNLQLLCPNCHSLTSNYNALNKNNGNDIRWKQTSIYRKNKGA